eukprot:3230495-Rhodomonas_salina.1
MRRALTPRGVPGVLRRAGVHRGHGASSLVCHGLHQVSESAEARRGGRERAKGGQQARRGKKGWG